MTNFSVSFIIELHKTIKYEEQDLFIIGLFLSIYRIREAEKKVKEIQKEKKASLSTTTTPVRSKGLVSNINF